MGFKPRKAGYFLLCSILCGSCLWLSLSFFLSLGKWSLSGFPVPDRRLHTPSLYPLISHCWLPVFVSANLKLTATHIHRHTHTLTCTAIFMGTSHRHNDCFYTVQTVYFYALTPTLSLNPTTTIAFFKIFKCLCYFYFLKELLSLWERKSVPTRSKCTSIAI